MMNNNDKSQYHTFWFKDIFRNSNNKVHKVGEKKSHYENSSTILYLLTNMSTYLSSTFLELCVTKRTEKKTPSKKQHTHTQD